jgi:hypothetical protein
MDTLEYLREGSVPKSIMANTTRLNEKDELEARKEAVGKESTAAYDPWIAFDPSLNQRHYYSTLDYHHRPL